MSIELKCPTCHVLAEIIREGQTVYRLASPLHVAFWIAVVILAIGFVIWCIASERGKKQ